MLKDILKEKLEKRKRKWWEWHKRIHKFGISLKNTHYKLSIVVERSIHIGQS